MLSIIRTVTIVLAGTVTVTGCGGEGGVGVAMGAAAAVVGESAESCRDFSALGGTLVLAVRFAGAASGAGVAGCRCPFSATGGLVPTVTRLMSVVSIAVT